MIEIFKIDNYLIPRIIIVLIFSFSLRQTLVLVNQKWITTFSHTLSLFLLPFITLCVTSVISNNLALSLGLVGALSIVRFRNPVKSPLELSLYFLCISVGICAAVSLKWPIIISFLSIFTITLIGFLDFIRIKLTGNSFFKTSFSEGNTLDTLEIECNLSMDDFLNYRELVSFINENNKFIYRFAFSDRTKFLKIYKDLKNNKDVINIKYNSA